MRVAERPWLLRGAVLGLALVVGIVASASAGDDGETPAPVEEPAPRIVFEAELADAAALVGHPVYWAGPVAGTSLELTESADGGTQVRYLAEGTAAGEGPAGALTVGSYPLPDPSGALESFAAEPGSASRRGRNGREVVVNSGNPTSVYFVSPDNSVQVEVYDPSPKRAMGLALSDRIRPVE